jgi:hypothetical protein
MSFCLVPLKLRLVSLIRKVNRKIQGPQEAAKFFTCQGLSSLRERPSGFNSLLAEKPAGGLRSAFPNPDLCRNQTLLQAAPMGRSLQSRNHFYRGMNPGRLFEGVRSPADWRRRRRVNRRRKVSGSW